FDLRTLDFFAPLATIRRTAAFFAADFGFVLATFFDACFALLAAFLAGFRTLISVGIGSDSSAISSSSRQPWASRTAIILRKMSFHVSCFIITAFGNMQPSQQMCRNV